jgi:hypothetical protein
MKFPASLVIVNSSGQVLARTETSTLSLPRVDMAPGRIGISLTRAVREQLALEVFRLITDNLPDRGHYLLRLQSYGVPLPWGYSWVQPSELIDEDDEELSRLSLLVLRNDTFGQYGWYSEVQTWIVNQVSKLGYSTLSLEQWNGNTGGVLLRVVTDGPQFWFKAVQDFNVREVSVAEVLSEKHPRVFPRVISTEPRWNAFLLEHIEGVELYECDDRSIWILVAELLADVQMDWVGASGPLLMAGAADLRPATMVARIPALLDHIDTAMLRQTKSPPNVLGRSEIDRLGRALQILCADVATLPFSEGLANADFSPHNALISSHGPVFIDWAEACVSLPLITGEYMWTRMVVEQPIHLHWQNDLRAAYFRRWAENYGARPVEKTVQILPMFSILAAAVFCVERQPGGSNNDDPYLRSLARKLVGAINHNPPVHCSL